MKWHLWHVFFILLISLWLGSGLFHTGWFISHDGIFHVRRAAEMVEMLRAGSFPVRYALSLDNNYGIPLFNYIYPGPYYLAAIPNLIFGIGLPTIIKLLMFTSLLGGALGWYVYFSSRRSVALAVSLVSLFTPYLLVNIYVRASLGEIITVSLLPWALLMQKQISQTGKIRAYSPLPLFLALISHNFLGYLALPLLVLHLFISQKHALRAIINILLSLGLASFFWLPMLAEKNLLISGISNNFSFPLIDHFVAPWQFITSPWGYGFSMKGTDQDGMTFQLGYTAIFSLVVTFVLGVKNYRRHYGRAIIIFGLALIFLLFLMTSGSLPLWNISPLLSAVQFPWRLLALGAIIVPLILGLSLEGVQSSKILYLFCSVICVIGIINTFTFRKPLKYLSRPQFASAYALWQNGTTTSFREEIAPRWSVSDHPTISTANGSDFRFAREVSVETTATFPKNYFPSWRGEIDDLPLTLSPTDTGEISYTMEPGLHNYHIYLGSTSIEQLANIMSLLSLGIILYLIRYTN